MNASAIALLGYATWTLVLLLAIAVLRTSLTVSGKRAANKFSPTGDDVSPFSGRLCRAHANCYEFFPILAGALGVALLTGNTAITDPLACWVLGARVVQSTIHVASTSVNAVTARFVFFVIQVGVVAYWCLRLWGVALG